MSNNFVCHQCLVEGESNFTKKLTLKNRPWSKVQVYVSLLRTFEISNWLFITKR